MTAYTRAGLLVPDDYEAVCIRCNGPRDRGIGYATCKACHAARARKERPAYGQLSPEAKEKSRARSIAKAALKRGALKRQPCQTCGADESQMHHHDYGKPLEVEWLCRPCHMDHHHGINRPGRFDGLRLRENRVRAYLE